MSCVVYFFNYYYFDSVHYSFSVSQNLLHSFHKVSQFLSLPNIETKMDCCRGFATQVKRPPSFASIPRSIRRLDRRDTVSTYTCGLVSVDIKSRFIEFWIKQKFEQLQTSTKFTIRSVHDSPGNTEESLYQNVSYYYFIWKWINTVNFMYFHCFIYFIKF